MSLLALCSGQRCQSIAGIKKGDVIYNVQVEILISSLIKSSGPGRRQPCIVLPRFEECPIICPVRTLECYVARTELLNNTDFLLISYNKPHSNVSSQTVSRWLKSVLSLAGINTSIYSAHSFRHSSTSKANSVGVNVDIIYSRAGWSERSQVFAKHYNRPIDQRHSFATSVLA